MRSLVVPVILALTACQGTGAATPVASTSTATSSVPAVPSAAGATPTTVSPTVQTLQSISSAASTASQVGAALGNPAVAGAGAAVAAVADTLANSSAANAQLGAMASSKLEYADVYIDMGDPTGMRAIVPYLMKPEVWSLIQVDMSGSSKHYRFMKVSTGVQSPEVDIFKPRH